MKKTNDENKNRKKLRKHADDIFSKWIRWKKKRCEFCESINNLQVAHCISRLELALRYSEDNVLCLCARCHLISHQNPLWFAVMVQATKGNEIFKKLVEFKTEKLTNSIEIYEKVINDYKQVIEYF